MPPGAIRVILFAMRAWTALLLLLTLGFTLGLGAHPCGATEREGARPTAQAAASAMPSCHSHPAPAAPADEEGQGSGKEHRCPHLCHATALPAMAPPIFTAQAVAQIVLPHAERPSAAPARAIDHVPLV